MIRNPGIFECALILSDQHSPFNVISVLRMDDPPRPESVRAALTMLQRRHPFLSATLQPKAFVPLPEPKIRFSVLKRESDSAWLERVEQEMNTRLDASSELWRGLYLFDDTQAELILTFHHAMTICAPVTAQIGATAALEHDRGWFEPILAESDRRRLAWLATLDALALPYARPRGAYYVCFDVRPTGLDAKTFVRRAAAEAGLTLGTGGGAAAEGFLRGSLMQRSPALEEGLERLAAFARGL